MNMLFTLAWRNALRNRRRTLFTLTSLLIGIALFVVARGLVDGIERTMVTTEIDAEQGHLRVMAARWYEDQDWFPLDIPFPEITEVQRLLADRFPGVQLTGRTPFSGQIGDGVRAVPCRGMVIDVAAYQRMFRIGDLPAPPEGARAWAWVGEDLAKVFELERGSRIVLQAKTRRGTRNALDEVVVAGIVSAGYPVVDNFTVFVPQVVGQALLDIGEGDGRLVTELIARFADPDQADQADALLGERYPVRGAGDAATGVVAESWREKTAYISDMNRIRSGMFNVVVAIILLIGAAGVANTCLMAGFERTKEVGTMLALGLGRGRILLLFVIESGLIAIAGATLGAGLGGSVSYWFAKNGVPFPKVDEGGAALPVPPILYFDARVSTLLIGLGLGLLIALAASIYPAWRSSRLDPIVALREV